MGESSSQMKRPRLGRRKKENDNFVKTSFDRLIDAFGAPPPAPLPNNTIFDCLRTLSTIPEVIADKHFHAICMKKLEDPTRRHIFMATEPELRASGTICGRKEMFNKRHFSLREVIERTFGVWKKKWVILRDMSSYPFQKQVHIVVATMTLYNFIRRHPSRSDTNFSMADNEELNVYEEPSEFMIGPSVPEDENEFNEFEVHDVEGVAEMAALRESIADAIYDS